jgi:hypothetical protein
MGDANAEQNSRLTRQVLVDIEVVLSSPGGRLASNPQEQISTRKFELDQGKPLEEAHFAC